MLTYDAFPLGRLTSFSINPSRVKRIIDVLLSENIKLILAGEDSGVLIPVQLAPDMTIEYKNKVPINLIRIRYFTTFIIPGAIINFEFYILYAKLHARY
jgi:hypothetical protein